MLLTWIDWLVIIGYLLINLAVGMYYRRRASGNTEEFFLDATFPGGSPAACLMFWHLSRRGWQTLSVIQSDGNSVKLAEMHATRD